jgi:galactokinase
MAVTLGGPFMAMRCQPAIICPAPALPADLIVYALDSGVSHEVSGIEYEAARAAAFMGYKIICQFEKLSVTEDTSGEIARYTDPVYNGYLANISPSVFARRFEHIIPEFLSGADFLSQFGNHVDPATTIIPTHVYRVRANTKYAVLENNRVTLFYHLLKGGSGSGIGGSSNEDLYIQLGELMYQSHDAYTECGLGSDATSKIVELVQSLGPRSGLFGAKITGGGAGGTVAVLGLRSSGEIFQREVVSAYSAARGLAQPPHVFVGSSLGADAYGIRRLFI